MLMHANAIVRIIIEQLGPASSDIFIDIKVNYSLIILIHKKSHLDIWLSKSFIKFHILLKNSEIWPMMDLFAKRLIRR